MQHRGGESMNVGDELPLCERVPFREYISAKDYLETQKYRDHIAELEQQGKLGIYDFEETLWDEEVSDDEIAEFMDRHIYKNGGWYHI